MDPPCHHKKKYPTAHSYHAWLGFCQSSLSPLPLLSLLRCSDQGLTLEMAATHHIPPTKNIPYQPLLIKHWKTSFEKNCFSAWASTLNMYAPTKG